MSYTETLFGGLVAIVFLYFAGRRIGLSNYWSALLGGAIPFALYLALSVSQGGAAGDVLAIHLAVFMATSGVLGVFGTVLNRKEKMHWAPKLLIAFFALLVVFNAALLSVSMHGLPPSLFKFFLPHADRAVVHTAFPGAVPHDRNKLYEPHQRRVEEQRQLGWVVVAEGLDQLRKGIDGDLVIRVADKNGKPVANGIVSLGLWRMANSGDDRHLDLKERAPGEYAARLTLDSAGKWIADLDIRQGENSYISQQPLTVAE